MTNENHGPYLRHAGTILSLANVYRGAEHSNGRKEDVATHTLMVVALTLDLAAVLNLPDSETLEATNAALCHDYAETITGEIDTLFPLSRQRAEEKEAAEKAANDQLIREDRVGTLRWVEFEGHWLAYYADKLCPILVGIHDDARRLHARGVTSEWLSARKTAQISMMPLPPEFDSVLLPIWADAVADLVARLQRREDYVTDGEGEG